MSVGLITRIIIAPQGKRCNPKASAKVAQNFVEAKAAQIGTSQTWQTLRKTIPGIIG